MKLIDTLGTIFMAFVVFVLYALFFHNRYVHPIGSLAGDIKTGTQCARLIPAFSEYAEKHDKARFTQRHVDEYANGNNSRDKITYILKMSDKGLFNNPVLTVNCDKMERVINYSLDIQ